MQALLALAVLLALGATAQAKPAPLEPQSIAISLNDSAINTGPSGATLESDYFHAPQRPYAVGRVFPCRLQLRAFDKTRLARSCD